MYTFLLWIYLINATLLIVHEIDSAYWKEWELFRLPGGLASFLLLHVFLVFLILYGAVLISQSSAGGLLLSLVAGLAGIFAFSIHTLFIRKGHPEFKTFVSQGILACILLISIIQVAMTILQFTQL